MKQNNSSLGTAEKILDAAEKLFAQFGYDAVSIRQITDGASVRLALAHYHFGTKEELFRAVVSRRIDQLSHSRLKLLQHFRQQRKGKPLPVERIVEAFIVPYLYHSLYGDEGWRDYAKVVSRLLTSNLEVLRDLFDPAAAEFLTELRRALPEADESRIQWGFDFMVGLMCNTFAEVDRIRELSDGLCSTEQMESACRHMLPFIVEGLKAVAKRPPFDFSVSFAELAREN